MLCLFFFLITTLLIYLFFFSQNILRFKHEIYLRTRDIYKKKKDFVYSSAFFSGNKNKDDSIKLKLIFSIFYLDVR